MTHTRETLEAMTIENLTGILKGMKLTARGKDTTLINRILEHQDKPPSPDSELSEQNDPNGLPNATDAANDALKSTRSTQ